MKNMNASSKNLLRFQKVAANLYTKLKQISARRTFAFCVRKT